jgi:hypothetical protein
VSFGERKKEGVLVGARRDQKEDELLEDGEMRVFEALKVETPEKASEPEHHDGLAETERAEAADAARKGRDGEGVTDRNEKNGGAETDGERKQGRDEGGVDSPSGGKRGGPSTSAGAVLEGDQEQSWVVHGKENLLIRGIRRKKKVSFPTY